MYEKQRSSMDLSELIFDPEITTAIATSFIDTPTMSLTPTTLATFEAEFNEAFTASQALTTEALVSQSSGGQFWPGASTSLNNFELDSDDDDDDDDNNDDDDDDSSMDSNSNFTGVTTKNNQGGSKVRPKSAAKGVKQQREVCAVKPVEQKQRKLPGPRPSKPIEEMTPIEAERRRRRRERNKNAAAKCRQRRLELTNELLAETEMLELESSRLEREIENLRRVKSQLEFVLESHKPICTAVLPVDPEFIPYPPPVQTTNAATTVGNVCVVRPNNLPIPSFSTASHGSSTTLTSEALEGAIFSFDTPTNLAGLTPFLAAGELGSPSSFNLFSP